ncbi:MAG TPA: substrate-binding domain-containing protein [Tepidisphaeraceae bacterium]|nr:substrate-binding domain-containing protein [Tepidisphaeraceae bacterium]
MERILRRLDEVVLPMGGMVQFGGLDLNTLDRVRAWNPDVLIFFNLEPDAIPAVLLKRAAVSIERDLTGHGIPSVLIDDHAVGVAAAEHLLMKKLPHYGVFAPSPYAFSARRAAGFRERLAAAGMASHAGDDWASEGLLNSKMLGAEQWARWLKRLPKPVGIFSPADGWCIDLITICHVNRINIPHEIAFVGASDHPTCLHCHPTISSVPIPFISLGEHAGRMAANMLSGRPFERRQVVSPQSLIERQSSRVLLEMPDDVRIAVEYISSQGCTGITAVDVIKHTVARRRSLERQFRKHVGRTILEEIQRVRLQQAQHLLDCTRMTTEQIAQATGFSSPRRLQAAFEKLLHSSPQRYRNRHRHRSSRLS